MKFNITLFLALVFNLLVVKAQVHSPGAVENVKIGEQEISFNAGSIFGKVRVYSPSVIRVQLDLNVIGDDFSYAVIGQVQKTKTAITQDDKSITILTDSIKTVVQKKPFAIAFYNSEGNVINQDEPGLTTSWVGNNVTNYKTLQENEHFVGLGEKTGNLDRQGNGYTNWNSDVYGYSILQDPLYSTIPFYIGIHHKVNYGIFFDNSYQSDFSFGASNNRFSSFGARGGQMNYYFIYHKNLADIIGSYTWLTGRTPLPPLWSLGYQQNRYSYYPEDEVLRIARTLREKRIPADGITLDIHYMDKYQLFTWNKTRFPNPVLMNDTLKSLGFRTTVIVDPGIKVQKGAAAFESGLKEDVYIKYPDGQAYTGQVWPGWCNFTDFTSAKGRAWWMKQVKFFAESGVSGIWNDMNEISTWGQKMPDNVLFDFDGKKTTHLEAHNVYGMLMARSSYEGALQQFKERPFLLSRSGYAGIQRFSAMWTGDNRAEEDHMLQGVRIMNSMGLSGVSFTGMDVGGFTGNPTTGLYTRWMELGAFLPYFRNHTTYNTRASEPWTFGDDVLEITRNYINLRYKLLPYIYSAFYQSSQNGLPVMRSLVIDNTFDENVLKVDFQNQYKFGEAFLVAPFESGKEYGKVYFPEGNWYNLYNDNVETGGTAKLEPLSIDKLPVYVKGGSIIPMQSLTQTTAVLPTDTLNVHVYNGPKTNSFVYYEDDGKSFDYKNGDYFKRTITFNPANKSITFNTAEGKYETHFKFLKLVLHGFDQAEAINVGKNHVKLNKESYSFLKPITNNDPQGSGSAGDNCIVKTVVITNNSKSIVLNY